MNNNQISDLKRILDLWLPEKIKYDQIPGLTVGIIDHGKIVYQGAFGYADVEKKKKMTIDTNFRIASISKTFTAMAIFELEKQKKLKLNDSILKYLPEMPKKLSGITIQQLMEHTSGLVRDGGTNHWENDRFTRRDMFLHKLKTTIPVYKPGQKFKYSNFANSILGEIIFRITGVTYEQYLNAMVKRLGMKNTHADLSSAVKNLASGYGRIIPGQKRQKFRPIKIYAYAPSAGFVSNVPDLLKYSQHFTKVFSKAHKNLKSTGKKRNFYGIGFEFHQTDGGLLMGHGGGFIGFKTNIYFNVTKNLGLVLLTNSLCLSAPIAFAVHDLVQYLKTTTGRNNDKKMIGLYRDRFGDKLIAPAGKKLMVFDVETINPVTRFALLQKKGNKYLIETKDGFASIGERVELIGKKLHWASDVMHKL